MAEELSTFVDAFLEYIKYSRGRSENTITNYSVDLNQFVDYLLAQGISSPLEITASHVRAFLREMMSYGYAQASAARKLSSVRSWVDYLIRSGVLEKDPTAGVRGPRLPQRLPRALAYDDVKRLLEEGPRGETVRRDRVILELLYGSGLRVAELIALDWEDIDLEERWIRVRGKGDKERLVPMGRYAVQALLAWKEEIGASAGPLFPGQGSGRMTVRTAHRVVTKLAQSVGLSGVTPHVLRHSFATHMLEHGANLRVLQELLGHESLVTTQRYLKITTDQLKRSYVAAHPRAEVE
jgi:integrase/recombinase XerC